MVKAWTRTFLATAAMTLALAPAAGAETYTVTGTADAPGACEGTTCASIRQALASAAANPGADTILVAEGAHQLTGGALQIASDVTMRADSARTTSVVGATEIDSAAVTLSRLTLRGEVRNQGGTVTLDRVRITAGTGIANRNGAMLVDGSLVDHNTGTGIVNSGEPPGGSGQLTVRNTTIAFNTGAGMSSSGTAADRVVLEHATIARNGGGGIVVPDSGVFSVGASIVADPCSGALPTSAGANVGCHFEVHDVDPALALDLTDQGGDTDVLAIGLDSPARNLAGTTCPATDQRGTARPQGPRCDAGAFELRYPLAIDSGPDGPTSQATPTFTFSSSEGLTDLQCRIDGVPMPCTDTYTPPAPLPDGAYTFRVENATHSATRSFTVDRTDPVVRIDSRPTDPTNDSNPEFRFSANEPATFRCTLVGPGHTNDPATECDNGEAFYRDLESGRFTFTVTAKDAAGTSAQAQFAFTVNPLLPDNPAITFPADDPHHQAERTVTLRGTGGDGSSIVVEENGQRVAEPVTVTGTRWERVIANVTPGAHTYAVHAENAAGATAAVTRTVIIDSGPAVTFDTTPPPFTHDNTPTFVFSASAPATFRCALDSAPLTSCSSPAMLDAVADGAHSFTVVATGEAGLSGDPATYAFVVDTRAPDPPTLTGPSGPTTATSAEFTFSAEPDARFECRLDAESSAACTSPKSFSALSESTHSFAVVAIDRAGNRSEPATRSWTVDHTAPAPPVIADPAEDAWLATPAFDVGGSAEPGATITLFAGTDPRGSATATATGAWTIALTAVADGTHRYTARATDAAGNASSSPERTVRVDTDPPETTITAAPGPLTNDATPEFAFTSDEPGATFQCRIDGGGFAPCPGEFGPFAEGAHTVTVRAVDPAGNVDPTPEERTFTVDLTAPAVPVLEPLDPQTRVPQVTLKGTADPLTTVRVFDGEALAGSPEASESGAWELPLTLAEGRHELTARAVDRAGNASAPTAPVSVTVDTIAPSLMVEVDRVISAHPTFTIDSDAAFTCTVDGAAVACAASFTPALADGPHTLSVVATDLAGNTTAKQVAFTVDSAAPTVSYSDGPPPDTNEATPRFTFAADEAGVTFRCSVDTGPEFDCDSPLTLPELQDGPHRLQVIATDAAGNSGPPASRSFTVDTKAPALDLSGPSGPTADNTPTFTFTAESEASTSCALDDVEGPCTSGQPLAALPDGTHTFRVIATDRAQNRTPREVVFRVDTRTPTATISGGPSGTVDAKTIVFAFRADESGVTFQCSLTDPSGKTNTEPCDGGLYMKDLKNGPYTFAVVATDAVGHVSAPARQAFIVAHDGPRARITLGPSGPTNEPAPFFAFDGPADAGRYECVIRRGNTPVQGPVECRPETGFRAEPLTVEGTYTLAIQAFTDDEDPGPLVIRTFVLDVTAPVASINAVPTSPTREPVFAFGSNEAGTLRCRLDDGAYTACGSPYAPRLGDGPHTLTIVAVDPAGNSSAPVSYLFTVDATPPPAADVTPNVQGNTASFSFTSGTLCRLDGPAGEGTFTACSSPRSYSGLAPGIYRFTVRTSDEAGNTADATREFSLTAAAAATPTATPSPRPVATPSPTASFQQSIVIRPVSGKILVKRPGSTAFVALERTSTLPLGTTVDAKSGRIQLTSEPARGLAPQKAIFYGGIFLITQPGTTIDLKLVEPLASCASKKATKLPKLRRAWGAGKGAFRITGKYSSATVRGTTWLVQDSCSGTLTRVKVGVIAVRDNITRKTILVRAGKSYLAKPRR